MLKKLILVLFFVVLLVGCKSENADKKILTFSSWGSITEVSILQKIIDNFERENPDIKVQFLHIPQNYFQKLHLLFASNTAPDVVFINNLNIPIYEKYLEDLSEYVDKKEFYPVAISSLTYNNKLLAIPRDVSNFVFYINIDKTAMPSSNWTIEDLLNMSKDINTKDCFALSYEDDIYWASPYIAYFTKTNLADGISNEEAMGINFYKNLKDRYKIAPTKSQIGSSTLAQMFLDEKVVFYLSGRWMFPKIKEKANFRWAVINFPYGVGEQLSDSSGWAVTKNSKNKDIAVRFVEYLSNEKNSEYFAKTGLIVPARIKTSKVLDNDRYNEKVFLELPEHSKPTNVNKDYKKIVDKINQQYFQ